MRACNWGDTLTRRVHENAAKRTAATTTRAQFCERAELFIALRPSDSGGGCASNFLGSACAWMGDAFGCPSFCFSKELLGSLAGCLDLRLEDDVTFAGPESFRRCAGADLFRPFGVLVVWVLI
jgi:hypothetical protein